MSRWEQVEPILREKAYRTLDNDPQVLLEHDGGPYGVDADVILARLYGLDDEIVEDGWRLRAIEPVLFLPITPSLRSFMQDTEPAVTTNAARYVLQSGYATVSLAAENAPPDVELRPDFTVKVLYLRYRRRL